MKAIKEINIQDIILIIGLGLFFYGIYVIYPPAAFILLGGFLMFMGWPGDRL